MLHSNSDCDAQTAHAHLGRSTSTGRPAWSVATPPALSRSKNCLPALRSSTRCLYPRSGRSAPCPEPNLPQSARQCLCLPVSASGATSSHVTASGLYSRRLQCVAGTGCPQMGGGGCCSLTGNCKAGSWGLHRHQRPSDLSTQLHAPTIAAWRSASSWRAQRSSRGRAGI